MTQYQGAFGIRSLISKVDEKDLNHDLFKAKPGRPLIRVDRVWERVVQDGSTERSLELRKDVGDSSQIDALHMYVFIDFHAYRFKVTINNRETWLSDCL
jgi:hypothetical protein